MSSLWIMSRTQLQNAMSAAFLPLKQPDKDCQDQEIRNWRHGLAMTMVDGAASALRRSGRPHLKQLRGLALLPETRGGAWQ
jgi:hypothetical protein